MKEIIKQIEKENPRHEKICFVALTGSRSYGTYTEQSDYDYRGFSLPNYKTFLIENRIGPYDRLQPYDISIYNLKDYLLNVLKGDPISTEILFSNHSDILICDEIGQNIIENRSKFLSQQIYKRLIGYSRSEYRKALGEKFIYEDLSSQQQDIINQIKNHFNLDKETSDDIRRNLLKNREFSIKKQKKQDVGAKRRKEIENFGYCVSSASHCLRLLKQVSEILLTAKITFPSPDKEILSDIKQGRIEKDKFKELVEEENKKVDEALSNSILPKKVNIQKVLSDIYLPIIEEHIKKQM